MVLTVAVAGCAIVFGVALAGRIATRAIFHPAVFVLLFAIVDVFFPAVYWALYGQVNNPEWLRPLTRTETANGLAYYSLFFALFLACLVVASGSGQARYPAPIATRAFERRLALTTWILLALILAQVGREVTRAGGPQEWLSARIVFSSATERDAQETNLLDALPLRAAFQGVVGLGFFYRRRLRHRVMYRVVWPVTALLLALSTMLRGTVLACALTLIFAETQRRRQEVSGGRRPERGLRSLLVVGVAVVLSLYVYGSVRDRFRAAATDEPGGTTGLHVPTVLTAGAGLLGVSQIIAQYGTTVDYFRGKTYLDMALLPVPRAIYPSKPRWYGIDDISKRMGWPETTQSAVTMPGEAFANFGLAGLLMAIPMGAGFGLMWRLACRSEVSLVLVGPTLFFQAVSVTMWMSFTGLMNAMPLIVLLIALGFFLERRGRLARRTRTEAVAASSAEA